MHHIQKLTHDESDGNVKSKIVKLLNYSRKLYNLRLGKDFFETTPKTQSIKQKIDESDFTKVKIIYSPKDTIKKTKRPATDSRTCVQNTK